MKFMEWFLRSNTTGARVLRTVVQGILAVIISIVPDLVGLIDLDPAFQAALVALIMAVLSPIMSEIGKGVEQVAEKKRMAKEAEMDIKG